MSQRAKDFFERWVAEHVVSIDDGAAAHRVSDMLIAAAAEGIPSFEFDEEFPVMDHQMRVASRDAGVDAGQ